MRIGIDLDGVVFDSEKEYRIYSELYDLLDLKRNSKINNKEMKLEKRFNWTPEEKLGFLNKYQKKVISEVNFMPGAKDVLKMLKDDGHNLIVISARGSIIKEKTLEITEERLKQDNMYIFDKYYLAKENKEEICLNENIDIMIDDSYGKCKSLANKKIKTIYLKDAPSYDLEENEYIKVLYNWGEIYRYIKELDNN